MSELFEPTPRWPGAPPICEATNRLAFQSRADWEFFHRANGPSCKVKKVWLCPHCEHWHAITVAPDPAGSSSGSGRSSK